MPIHAPFLNSYYVSTNYCIPVWYTIIKIASSNSEKTVATNKYAEIITYFI